LAVALLRLNLNCKLGGRRGETKLVLGSWFLVLGSWFLVLGSWFFVLGVRTLGDAGVKLIVGIPLCFESERVWNFRRRPVVE